MCEHRRFNNSANKKPIISRQVAYFGYKVMFTPLCTLSEFGIPLEFKVGIPGIPEAVSMETQQWPVAW